MNRRPLSLLAVLGAVIAGCATQQPQPYYAPPPPRALTIYAEGKQSQRQQDRDKADCQSMASRQATSSDAWANLFIGCMNGRGYRVE